ncbi:MAG: beta-galactosidase, partial [Candidatus Peregrinibacteria bacterium]
PIFINSKLTAFTILAWFMLATWCCGMENFQNPSFENGTDGWTIQYDKKGMDKPWSIDPRGYQSTQSLKVVLPNPFAIVTLENAQPITLSDPSRPYILSFACRFENPLLIRALALRAQFLKEDGSPLKTLFGEGWELAEFMVLYLVSEEKIGDWSLRKYVIPPVKDAKAIKVTLEFYGSKGAFWIDGLNLEKKDGGRTPEKFLYYNPFNAPLGVPPYEHLVKLTQKGSPWLKSGDAFNRAMVAQSLAQEKLEEWERACGYLGKKADEALVKENERFLSRLNALYETFGKLFLARTPEKLEAEINQPVASLRTEIEKYRQQIEKFLKQETEKAGGGANGGAVTGMTAPKPIVIDESGRPNQLVFSSLSKDEHFEMEKNLCDFKRVYTLYKYHNFGYGLSPDKKSIDFDAVKKEIEKWSAQGVEYPIIALPFSDTGGSIVMPEFLEKHWNDPEIYMQQKYKPPPSAFNQNWGRKPYNIFNPAVREACREAAAAFGKNLKEYKKIYGFCREGGGPFVNGRTAGYGEVAKREFQKHLEKKFGSIQKLNAALKTDYQRFEDISQPLDKRSTLGTYPYDPIPVTKPLSYEFESWIHQVAVDFNTMIYREIKRHDPQAIVLSDHNDVFESMGFNPMAMFDYCDMVSNHAKPHLIDIFRSLARHRPDKNFGAFEDQWGKLWEDPRFDVVHRPSEERAWRSYIIKHVGKLADRDYTLQSWWYSYTRGEFILTYGSGHWAVPSYDLTIFRYWFTGLPTGIEMVRHFEK